MKVIPYRPGKEVEEEQEGEDLMLLEEEALTDNILHLLGQGKVGKSPKGSGPQTTLDSQHSAFTAVIPHEPRSPQWRHSAHGL
ncbi:hypothetical protein Y1Q_0016615 [Alligator mississippiensis]|uniref:Uncharacterized protein n=1 Tax=Alligator mississippiensis TaxID=8496 RepID=A0A151NC75_ALLMI|nr:hypothetical protein Y1Q_0016615 [Alligator mississippiensis]